MSLEQAYQDEAAHDAESQTTLCICPRFSDLASGTIIADLTCPVHGVDDTDPGDVLPAEPYPEEQP